MKARWIVQTAIFFFGISPLVSAKVIRVKAGSIGASTGESWQDAIPELQDALTTAVSGDEIWVASGDYKATADSDVNASFELQSGVAIYGGFSGSETIRHLRNSDPATNNTVLSGDLMDNDSDEFESRQDNSRSIVTAANLAEVATLDGFTIRNGGIASSLVNRQGGGIRSLESTLNLENLNLLENQGNGGGGAYFAKSTISLRSCSFIANDGATTSDGGGISGLDSNISARNCRFQENAAVDGAGIYILRCQLFASGLTLVDNQAIRGGGIFSRASEVRLWNSMLARNGNLSDPGSFRGSGGGVFSESCDFEITNCSFVGNLVKQSAGAIQVSYNSFWDGPESVLRVTNSTFFGNGVTETHPFFPQSVFHCGGQSSLLLQNSIVRHTPDQTTQTAFSGRLPIAGSCCNLIQGGLDGYPSIIDADPKFVDPVGPDGIPGTLDDDLQLQGTSPAIGLGDSSLLPEDALDLDLDSDLAEATPLDLAGQPRASAFGLDLGAFEKQGLFFASPNVEMTAAGNGEISIPNWLAGHTDGDGFIFRLIRLNAQEALPFSAAPSLSPSGTLSFTPESGAEGTAIYQISVEDPSGEFSSPPPQTFSIHIGRKVWRVDHAAEGLGDGTTWSDAFERLEDALAIAKPGDQIWIAEGRYTPGVDTDASFRIPNGLEVYGGFSGSEMSLPERNSNPLTNNTLLDGDLLGDDDGVENRSDNSLHVVTLDQVDSSTILDGFTIRGGEAMVAESGSKGGGILTSGSPHLRNLHLTGNQAIRGGGIASLEGAPMISHCHFTANISLENGGAISLENDAFNQITEVAFLENSNFSDNEAGEDGGAVEISYSEVLIQHCRFEANSARYGGALRILRSTVDILGSDYLHNTAAGGGALSTLDSGGRKCLNRFLGNSASFGGGACQSRSSTENFVNCLFSGNTATGGGAMHLGGSRLEMVHCTLSGNSADNGGGLLLDAEEEHLMQNCILWGNTSYEFPSEIDWHHDDYRYSWEIPERLTNLAASSGGLLVRGGIRNRTDVILSNPIFVNPMGPDGVAGTEDDDLRTDRGSPAQGTGLSGVLPPDTLDLDGDDDVTEELPHDLDRNARQVGPGVDLGTYEAITPSIYFPDVRLPVVPEAPILLSSWAVVEPVSYSTAVSDTSGTLSFAVPPSLSPTGDLAFEVSSSTSGWAKITVSIDHDGVPQTVGSFSILVSPVVHYVDAKTTSPGNGTSWNEPFDRLSDALENAFDGDEIRVTTGTYYASGAPSPTATFHLRNGVHIRGGFEGSELDNQPLDPSARSTLSGRFPLGEGQETRAFNVVTALEVDESTLLESLIITGGGERNDQTSNRGAGLTCIQASPILRHVAIIDNRAAGNGGGVYFSGSSAQLDRCFIGGNLSWRDGGGLYFGAATDVLITNSIFSGNQSYDEGGGLYVGSGSSGITLANCTVVGNSSQFSGAGIQGRNTTSAIYNTIIYDNHTTRGNISETGSGPFDEDRFFGNIIRGGYRQLEPPLVIDANPLFVNPEGSDGIPGTLDDDFRLLVSSPAIDAGEHNNLPGGLITDYLNQPRVAGPQIDIGATEGSIFATFQLLNPNLDPEGDSNHNGSSNFTDYAAGGNPRERHDPALLPRVSDGNLILSVRNNASDVSSQFQKSFDLDLWNTLLEDTDYTTQNPVVSQDGRDILTLRLVQPLPPRIFFRQLFQPNP